MSGRYAIFSHGEQGTPWSGTFPALADVARAEAFEVESVDYRGVVEPEAQLTRLLNYCRGHQGRLVLIGAGTGAVIATAAAKVLRADGLFLIAPAFYGPAHARLDPPVPLCPTTIVHGWRDEFVPVETSLRYARENGAVLHLYDSDHSLVDRVRELIFLFEFFVVRLDGMVGSLLDPHLESP